MYQAPGFGDIEMHKTDNFAGLKEPAILQERQTFNKSKYEQREMSNADVGIRAHHVRPNLGVTKASRRSTVSANS